MSVVLRFHIWLIMTVYYKYIITKCDGYFITKYDRSLLQNGAGFNYKMQQFYWKNATIITKCDNFITKCYSYYKMWRLLQIILFNLIEGVGGRGGGGGWRRGKGAIPIIRENCNPFALFPFIKTSLSNDQMKMFIYSTNPFLLQTPFLPTQFINQVFSWEFILKDTGVDTMCFFFQNAEYSRTKHDFFWIVLWNQSNIEVGAFY